MTSEWSGAEERRRKAEQKLVSIRGAHDEWRRLAVRCRRGHHVADVFDVEGELVYASRVSGRGHGRRDRVDSAHHGQEHGVPFADLLRVPDEGIGGADADLPASCECGPHHLQRSAVLAALERSHRLMTLA